MERLYFLPHPTVEQEEEAKWRRLITNCCLSGNVLSRDGTSSMCRKKKCHTLTEESNISIIYGFNEFSLG